MPRPPRCFYNSFGHFIFGIVSPSLYLHHLLTQTDKKAIEFFKRKSEYERALIGWKIEKRIATKQEYKQWRKENGRKKV